VNTCKIYKMWYRESITMARFRDDLNTIGTGIRKAPGFLVGAVQKTATDTFSARKKKTIMSALEFGPENGFKLLGVVIVVITLAVLFSFFRSESGLWVMLIIFVILYDIFFSKGWIAPAVLGIFSGVLETFIDIGKGILMAVFDIGKDLLMTMYDIGMSIGRDLYDFAKSLIADSVGFIQEIGADIVALAIDIVGIAREIVTDMVTAVLDIVRDIVTSVFAAVGEIVRDIVSGMGDLVKDIFSFKSN
jgi:hypothetical protein